MQLMADVDVADVVPTPALTEEQNTKPLDFTWVHKWKGMVIRSRLCVRGSKLWIKDLDDTFVQHNYSWFASFSLYLHLACSGASFTFDITAAFLMQSLILTTTRSSSGLQKNTSRTRHCYGKLIKQFMEFKLPHARGRNSSRMNFRSWDSDDSD